MVKHPASPVSRMEQLLLLCHLKKVRDNILKEFAGKIRAMDIVRNSVEFLVLGSSHAQLGWIANDREFNLGMAYQDLHCTYHLYRRYADSPALKSVIVFFSVFSYGSRLIMTGDARICAAFKVAAGVDWEDADIAKVLHLDRLCRPYRRKVGSFLSSHRPKEGDRGNIRGYVPSFTCTAEERASAHYKNSDREIDMLRFLAQLVDDAESRGQSVYVVIPPAPYEYRRAIPSGEEIFRRLKNEASRWRNVALFDHYEDARFDLRDFLDWDHLSSDGAAKLTEIVRKEMKDGKVC